MIGHYQAAQRPNALRIDTLLVLEIIVAEDVEDAPTNRRKDMMSQTLILDSLTDPFGDDVRATRALA